MKPVLWILFFLIDIIFSAQIPDDFKNYIDAHPGAKVKVWVFFKDKPGAGQLQKATALISEKALQRRDLRGTKPGVDKTDFPVSGDYLKTIESRALKIGHSSRWLNGVAVWIKAADIIPLLQIDFIREIRPVGRRVIEPEHATPAPPLPKSPFHKTSGLDYGPSAFQLEQIGVPALHEKGLSGKGVVVAMLDDGFRFYKRHTAFSNLKVIAVYDFVNNDSTVDDLNAPSNKGTHGSETLSVLGGFAPGHLIGPAYGASFLLAKTEIDSVEIPLEEDNWVAGLEWAEARGADIVSSSLGYIDWYTQQDMDGRTAVTTLATVVAEQKGLIVVNSAGNEGRTGYDSLNTLIAPADGEFVITAGGVTNQNVYWVFASGGPTIDGRIKPDVSALANNAYMASPWDEQGYVTHSGTSFSCPLISGAIALLLEAYPALTPRQVRELIRRSASIADAPDNKIGYGILNIAAAYDLAAQTNGNFGWATVNKVGLNYPNPFSDYTRIPYKLKTMSRLHLRVYNSLGRLIYSTPQRSDGGAGYFIVTADNLKSQGVYFYSLEIKENTGKRHVKYGKLLYLR